MKLVLNRDVSKLGKKHDVVDVRRGYGRNFLLPQGMATLATPAMVKRSEVLGKKREERKTQMQAQAKELAQKIKNVKLTFEERVTSKGALYGSIDENVIATELSKQIEFTIDPEAIIVGAAIRTLGAHRVNVRLNQDIDAVLHISVKKLS
ncbi:50S ribosomal protein L9 [Candidatus Gracilibacteria bacterium]|nr:50S ribosomal protein L9 [Candidatus Gracilibacteria bacterium]